VNNQKKYLIGEQY